jgi:outer membrane biogenesis lipoprotein LolB
VSLRRLLPILLFLLVGCRTTQAPLPEPISLPDAGTTDAQSIDPRAAHLLASLESLRAQRISIRADAKLAVDGPETNLRSTFIIGAEQESQMYIEVLSFLQQTLAILITDGNRYELIRANGRSLKSGRVRSNLLWKAASIPLPMENAVDVLLGVHALDPEKQVLRSSLLKPGGMMLLVPEPEGGYSQLSFDETGRLVKVTQYDDKREVRWVVHYSGWQVLGEDEFPHELSMDFPGTRTQVRISYRDVVLNPAFPEGFFAVGSTD